MGTMKTKIKLPPPAPRTMEDLQRAHADLCVRAGSVQYQISILSEELANLNKTIRSVNEEAGVRKKLDAPAADEAQSA